MLKLRASLGFNWGDPGSETDSVSTHESLRMNTHPILPLLFLRITLYVAAHAGVAGGAVDAGDAVGGVLSTDAEVGRLGGTISWGPKRGISSCCLEPIPTSQGTTSLPKSTNPRTTTCLPSDITFCSLVLVLRSLSRWVLSHFVN